MDWTSDDLPQMKETIIVRVERCVYSTNLDASLETDTVLQMLRSPHSTLGFFGGVVERRCLGSWVLDALECPNVPICNP